MKIIKRSGMEVEFDRSKIIAAVKRANNSVVEAEKVSDEQVEKIPDLVHAPVMLNMSEGAKTPLRNNAEIRNLGYKLVIWPSSATWAAARAIQEIYQILKDKGTTGEDLEKLILFHEFNDLIGLPEVMRLSDEYKTGTTY